MSSPDDDQTGSDFPPQPAPPAPSGPAQPTLADRLMSRRVLIAGAAGGVGVIGITGALLAGGNDVPTAQPSTRSTSTRPSTSRPTTSRATSRPPTSTTTAPTTAPPTTTAPTTAPTTTAAAPPTSSSQPPPPTSSSAPPPTTTTPAPPPPPPPPPGEFLANTADVPLKGGVIVATGRQTVVTHPSASTFCAFTAICTHEGCVVSEVARNTITCFCHGSQYDAATGEVTNPPAPLPLARKSIVVQDGKIYLV